MKRSREIKKLLTDRIAQVRQHADVLNSIETELMNILDTVIGSEKARKSPKIERALESLRCGKTMEDSHG